MIFGNPKIPTSLSPLRRLNARAKESTLNLALGQPEVDMPAVLRELAAHAISRHSLGYTPNAGRADLRAEVARFYGLAQDQIVITHGAQEGLMAVLCALLQSGDQVLLPDPGFLAYPTMVKMAGGCADYYPLVSRGGRFEFSVDLILSRLKANTRAVLVCSPNNPTGSILGAEEKERLIRELERREIFLLCDDVYSELVFGEEYSPSSRKSNYVVTVSSWSKALALTGWRIGFLHCPHLALFEKVLAAHQYLVTCANAPAQALLLETLRAPDLYRQIVDSFKATYARRLQVLGKLLALDLDRDLPGGGFYYFLPLAEGCDKAVAELLLTEKDLLVVPGSFFGQEGKGYLRVSVAAADSKVQRAGEILFPFQKKSSEPPAGFSEERPTANDHSKQTKSLRSFPEARSSREIT